MDRNDKASRTGELLETCTVVMMSGMINAGKHLRDIKNNKYYEFFGYDTFNQYLSSHRIMPRSARRYIAIVEKYIDELKVEEERLYSITPARLEKMIPFIGECNIKKRDEWLARAETNSNKDFIGLVNEEKGQTEGMIEKRIWNGTKGRSLTSDRAGATATGRSDAIAYTQPAGTPRLSLDFHSSGAASMSPRMSPKEYMAMVKKADCVLCPGKKNYGRGHHFPITVGAGAKKWRVIPLCETCHVEAHHDPKEFLWKYKKQIIGWIYDLIVKEE